MIYELWVPGPLTNPLRGSWGHWSKHARWARQWRERTAMAWLAQFPRRPVMEASTPKLIRFVANTGATWDDDNLRAGMKPLRDALMDVGIIQSDTPAAGHRFEYSQRIDRKNRGVHITIAPHTPATAAGTEG